MDLQDIYRRIIVTADDIKEKSAAKLCSSRLLSTESQTSDFSLPALHISCTTSPLTTFVAEGIPVSIAQRLSDRLDKSLLALRQTLEDGFQQTWQNVLGTPRHNSMLPLDELHKHLCKTYQSLYDSKVSDWVNEIGRKAIVRLARSEKKETSKTTGASEACKPLFNQSYLPVLEAFFAEEPFPSRADKLYLAKKSGMTFRQIHVWFQNRRSRIKKPGIEKLPVQERSSFSPSDTEVECDHFKKENSISRSSSITLVSDDDGFSQGALPYTFPTKYPPDLIPESDPFPCRFGDFSSFRKPVWERVPSTLLCFQEETSVDSLIEAFSRMEITPKSTSSHRQLDRFRVLGESTLTTTKSGCTASPFTIYPLPAPLPSLVRDPSRYTDLRSCFSIKPSDHSFVMPTHKEVQTQSYTISLSAFNSLSSTLVSKPQRAVNSDDDNSAPEFKNKSISPNRPTKGARKKPGLPKRIPTGRMIKSVPMTVHSEGLAPLNEVLDHSSSLVIPSLSFSSSSSSCSETQSPTSSIHSLPEIPSLSSSTVEMGGMKPSFDTSEFLDHASASAVSLPQFVSSDFTFDLFSKPPAEDLFDLSFPPLYATSLSQPALPTDIAAPTLFPLSFDFTSTTS